MWRFSGVGVTDNGLVRDQNEDSAFLGAHLALVADGVGGAAAGEVASATAAYVVAAHLLSQRVDDLPSVLGRAVAVARDDIVRGGGIDPTRAGMATTLTALATNGHEVALAHIGDSRAYRLSHGMLSRISTDHTYVQRLIDHGEIEPEAARQHPWRNVVLRSLTSLPTVPGEGVGNEPDIFLVEAAAGDRLMVCSDGLSDLVPEEQMTAILSGGDPRSAADALLAAALDEGGSDNITCLVLDLVDGPPVIGDGQLLGAVRDPTNIVDPALRTGTLPA